MAGLLACVSLSLPACANSYAGIALAPGKGDPELQALALRAQAGDKQAQLELGARYEEGAGVPVDFRRAARLYRSAARGSGGTTYVYSPPVGPNSPGRVIPIDGGPRQQGSAEARARLAALRPKRAGNNVAPVGGKAGDFGFRQAEHVLAAAVEIRGEQRSYISRIAEDPQRASCLAERRCTFERYFDVSVGARSRVALLFMLELSDVGDITCDRARPDNSCTISASVYLAGNEAFPHCVRVEPLRRAAGSHGWRNHPFRHPYDPKVSRYRHSDDNNTFLFIRTLSDNRCFQSFSIARIPLPGDPIRN